YNIQNEQQSNTRAASIYDVASQNVNNDQNSTIDNNNSTHTSSYGSIYDSVAESSSQNNNINNIYSNHTQMNSQSHINNTDQSPQHTNSDYSQNIQNNV